MNSTLFKTTLKSNYFVMIIIALVILMYEAIMIGMFDPENTEVFSDMVKLMPEGLINAMGFNAIVTNLTSFIGRIRYS